MRSGKMRAGTYGELVCAGTFEEVCTTLGIEGTPGKELERLLRRRGLQMITLVDLDDTRTSAVYDFTGGNSHNGRHRADRLLNWVEAWTPIKLREELLGDIREDVEHRREQGWTEKKLRRLIWWQLGYAIVGWLWGRAERVLALILPAGK